MWHHNHLSSEVTWFYFAHAVWIEAFANVFSILRAGNLDPYAMCRTALIESLKEHCHLHSQHVWQIITIDANYKNTITLHSCN